jgi:hypothetical protein
MIFKKGLGIKGKKDVPEKVLNLGYPLGGVKKGRERGIYDFP